ncbi:unnamed protein product [Phytophthora fragariaefolia]|uniref:Unnamed protein product n=1 Tax=Phytophthora fragariaefolia TaxID=1490495 RepID=A0A9W6WVM8_9STRA|nr:unnamed protein product [Phytophthora fragariaefolia]
MRRYDLSLRRATNLTVLTEDVLTDRAVRYMEYLSARKDSLNMNPTVLMDEMAVYFEHPRHQAVAVTVARHVVLKSTGFASMHITAVLAVSASGRNLPPLIVCKGANQDGSYAWKSNCLDSMRAHISKAVKARVVKKDLQMLVIPGGLAPYVQTGDIGICKSFKDKLSVIIDEWKLSDRVVYTKAGNPKPPHVEDAV